MLRTATLTFNSSTPEEVLEQIASVRFPPDSKWVKRYPGAREVILEGIETEGRRFPDSKWGWEWIASRMKKDIIPALFEAMDPDSFENKKKIAVQQEYIDIANEVINTPVEEMQPQEGNPDQRPYTQADKDKSTANLLRHIERYEAEIKQIQSIANNYAYQWELRPYTTAWDFLDAQGYLPNQAFQDFAVLGPLADRYNIPIDFAAMPTFGALAQKRQVVEEHTRDRERSRRFIEGFKDGTYAWDEKEPLKKWDDGWAVYPLATPNDLTLETKFMDHCIGKTMHKHRQRIIDGITSAVSLRDPNGIPHASAELTADGYELASLQGNGNHGLKPEYGKRMHEYFKGSGLDSGSDYWYQFEHPSHDRDDFPEGDYSYHSDDIDEQLDRAVAGEDEYNGEYEPPEPIEKDDPYWDNNELQPPPFNSNDDPFVFLREMVGWVKALKKSGNDILAAATVRTWFDPEGGDQNDLTGEYGGINWERQPVVSPFAWYDYRDFIEKLVYEIVYGEGTEKPDDEQPRMTGYGENVIGETGYGLNINQGDNEWHSEDEEEPALHRGPEDLYELALGYTYLEELLNTFPPQSTYHTSEGLMTQALQSAAKQYGDNEDVEYFMTLAGKVSQELEANDYESIEVPHRGYLPGQHALVDELEGYDSRQQQDHDDWAYENDSPAPEWTLQGPQEDPDTIHTGDVMIWSGEGGGKEVIVNEISTMEARGNWNIQVFDRANPAHKWWVPKDQLERANKDTSEPTETDYLESAPAQANGLPGVLRPGAEVYWRTTPVTVVQDNMDGNVTVRYMDEGEERERVWPKTDSEGSELFTPHGEPQQVAERERAERNDAQRARLPVGEEVVWEGNGRTYTVEVCEGYWTHIVRDGEAQDVRSEELVPVAEYEEPNRARPPVTPAQRADGWDGDRYYHLVGETMMTPGERPVVVEEVGPAGYARVRDHDSGATYSLRARDLIAMPEPEVEPELDNPLVGETYMYGTEPVQVMAVNGDGYALIHVLEGNRAGFEGNVELASLTEYQPPDIPMYQRPLEGDQFGDYTFQEGRWWYTAMGPQREMAEGFDPRQARVASSGENWVYFDGKVKRGLQPHHTLLNHLTEHMVGEEEPGAIAHAWAAGSHLPLDIPNAVARGSYDKAGRPFFWESNVDRNAVYDAAMQTTAHVKTAVIRQAEGDELVYDSMGRFWPFSGLSSTMIAGDTAINSYEDDSAKPSGTMLYKMVNGMVWVDSIYAVDGTPAAWELFGYLKQTHPGVQIEGMFMNNRLKVLADRYNRSLGHTPLSDEQRHEQTGMTPEQLEMLRPMFEQANEGRKLEPLNRGTQMMASFGYYETPEEMYGKIQASGWNVVSQGARAGQWVVVIQNQEGGKVERTGQTQEQALAAALTWTWQHSHMSKTATAGRYLITNSFGHLCSDTAETAGQAMDWAEEMANMGEPGDNFQVYDTLENKPIAVFHTDEEERHKNFEEHTSNVKTAWDWGTDKRDLQNVQWEEEAPQRARQQEEWAREQQARKDEWSTNRFFDLGDLRTDAYSDIPRKKKEPFVPPPPPEKKPRAPRVKKEPVVEEPVVEAPVEEAPVKKPRVKKAPVVQTPEENLMDALDRLDTPGKKRVKKVAPPPVVEEPVVEEPVEESIPGLRAAPPAPEQPAAPNGKTEYWKRRKENEAIDKALRDRGKALTPEEAQAAQDKVETLMEQRDERAKTVAPPAKKAPRAKPNPMNEPVTPKGESFLKRDPNEVPVVKKAPVPRAAPRPTRERTGPPNVAQDALRNNPGITVEQIAADNGISVEKVRKMLAHRVSMADRSGIPEVDALIEEFLKMPQGDWTTDDTTYDTLRDPELAHGACESVTNHFVEFAKSKGFKAYVTNTDLDEMGYTPSIEPFGEIGFDEKGEMQYGFYPEHTIATIVLDDPAYPYGREIYIDFTASQYGYTDHPKVTSKTALGKVFYSLRPNEDDGAHFGFQAYSKGYSYDEMERFLSDVKRDEITPGWASFHRAAKKSYLSRGWRVVSSELRIYDDSLPGGMERRPVIDLEQAKQEGYWALGNTNCYRATVYDPLSHREIWDSDKDWMKDPPEGESEFEDNSIVVPDPQMSLFESI